MNLFKNWQKKKSKKKEIRKLELLREKITLSQIRFYDWLTHKDISENINFSLYVPGGI